MIHNMIWMNYYLICNISLHLGQTLDDTVILDSPNKLFAMLWFQDNPWMILVSETVQTDRLPCSGSRTIHGWSWYLRQSELAVCCALVPLQYMDDPGISDSPNWPFALLWFQDNLWMILVSQTVWTDCLLCSGFRTIHGWSWYLRQSEFIICNALVPGQYMDDPGISDSSNWPFALLWFQDNPWMILVSQTVQTDHLLCPGSRIIHAWSWYVRRSELTVFPALVSGQSVDDPGIWDSPN